MDRKRKVRSFFCSGMYREKELCTSICAAKNKVRLGKAFFHEYLYSIGNILTKDKMGTVLFCPHVENIKRNIAWDVKREN